MVWSGLPTSPDRVRMCGGSSDRDQKRVQPHRPLAVSPTFFRGRPVVPAGHATHGWTTLGLPKGRVIRSSTMRILGFCLWGGVGRGAEGYRTRIPDGDPFPLPWITASAQPARVYRCRPGLWCVPRPSSTGHGIPVALWRRVMTAASPRLLINNLLNCKNRK